MRAAALAFVLFPAVALAQPAGECDPSDTSTIEAISAALDGARDASAKKLAGAFAKALADSGRLSADEAREIEAAIPAGAGFSDTERALADLVIHDRELDADEAEIASRLLAELGVEGLPLATVPAASRVAAYDLEFDLCGNGPYKATARITMEKAGDAVLEIDPERLKITKTTGSFEVKNGRLYVDTRAKTIAIEYEITATTEQAGYGLVRDPRSGRMWTMLWPDHAGALFPSNSSPADGATGRVKVNGCGKEVVATNPENEVPAYALAFYAADDFERGDVGRVRGYGVGRSVSPNARDAYRAAADESLAFYESWLGKFEYGPEVGVVELAAGGMGGMEHVGAVAIMMDSARDPEYAPEVAAHEVAHHWFGDNLRIASWPEFWMSEGFTDYATWRYFRSKSKATWRRLLLAGRGAVKSQLRSSPHPLRPHDGADIRTFFDSIPYEQGAWTLRMIEADLGTDRFDAILRDWYREHRFHPVSTDAFLAHLSRETGRDWSEWFESWNSIDALPSFDGQATPRGTRVDVKLTPKTTIPAALKSIPLVLTSRDGETKTIHVKPGTDLTIDAGFEVLSAEWDPDLTVLAEVR